MLVSGVGSCWCSQSDHAGVVDGIFLVLGGKIMRLGMGYVLTGLEVGDGVGRPLVGA